MAKPALRAKTTKLELEHPTEGKCGWVLELHGFDSSAVRNTIKTIAVKRADRPEDDKISTLDRMNADEQDNAEIAASAIAGWNDTFAEADDSIGPYSAAKAVELMREVEIAWVREQIESCLRKRANFFRIGD